MILTGYPELLLDDIDVEELTFDGAELVGLPSFWAAHLRAVVDDEDVLVEAWGRPAEEIRATYQRLTDTAAWPVFIIELEGDAHLAVIYRNDADDPGTDYLLFPAGRPARHPDRCRRGQPAGAGSVLDRVDRGCRPPGRSRRPGSGDAGAGPDPR